MIIIKLKLSCAHISVRNTYDYPPLTLLLSGAHVSYKHNELHQNLKLTYCLTTQPLS